jgi:hypothetical protein
VKIIRTFPDDGGPEGRSYVQDDLEKLYTRPFDISGLKQYHDDIVLLEWDIAVSRLDLARFTANAKGDWPVVAPFLDRRSERYMHWRKEPVGYRAIRKDEPTCDLFGFGMVYFPEWVIRDYPMGYGNSNTMTDGNLPRWLQEQEQRPVPVDWTITVVHLG